MSDKQWRRVEYRTPSPALRCAVAKVAGVAFCANEVAAGFATDFIAYGDLHKFFGYVDSYVAHMLWTRCGGCVGVVEEE